MSNCVGNMLNCNLLIEINQRILCNNDNVSTGDWILKLDLSFNFAINACDT